MNQFAALMTQVLMESAKAAVEILNETVNPLTYFDDEDDCPTSCRDDMSIYSPIEVYIGKTFKAEDIKIRLRPEQIEIEAQEQPFDVVGAKVRTFVDVPFGVNIIDAVYDADEGSVKIYLTLPDHDDDIIDEVTPTAGNTSTK